MQGSWRKSIVSASYSTNEFILEHLLSIRFVHEFRTKPKSLKNFSQHLFKDFGCALDELRTQGGKYIFLSGPLPTSFRGKVNATQKLFAHDSSMVRLKAFNELLDKIVGFISRLAFVRFPLEFKAQDHECTDERPADTAPSHSRAKGPRQRKSSCPIQTIVLAETGQYGLSSTETLVKQIFCFLRSVHM